MKKSILEQTQEEILSDIDSRAKLRSVRVSAKPKRLTIAALAKAWRIPKAILIEAINEQASKKESN